MKIDFLENFLKRDLENRDADLHDRIRKVIRAVASAPSVRDIPNLEKMKGHKTAYRIRTGRYRVGVYVEGDTVIFADFDHRKDIYSRFP